MSTGVNVLDGANQCLGCSYDGTALRVYVGATLVGIASTSDAISYTLGSHPLVGRSFSAPGTGFDAQGVIDQVRVYRGMLTGTAMSNVCAELVPAPGISVTHSRFTTADAALGTFPVATDTDHSVVLGSPFGMRWAMHKADTGSLTEFFVPHCRTFVGGVWGAWTAVGNTLGSLGVRYYVDTAVNLGATVGALLPLEGFVEVGGKVIADTVDVTSPYDAAQQTTISQGQHAENEARLTTGAPLIAGNLVQCRPHRENAAAFCTDCYGGSGDPAIRTLTLQGIAAPASLRAGGTSLGGTTQ